MSGAFFTKQGYVMNRALRKRVIEFLVEHRGVTLGFAAGELGINRRKLQDYLTKEVRAEIEVRRLGPREVTLADVDKAMMEQARGGNVAAARLVYMRMAQRGDMGPLPSLEAMEAELEALKKLEKQHVNIKGVNRDGANFDDGIAVDDDAHG